jgi:hypothetical protein
MALTDTHPVIERQQVALLRRAGAARRAQLMASLTQSALELSRQAVSNAHPGLTPLEQRLKFFELCYGERLTAFLRAQLARRPR